tara:strand:+ start:14296 stop:15759 length:1464 start_codon:yes stop_codon:yes gene_type:complete
MKNSTNNNISDSMESEKLNSFSTIPGEDSDDILISGAEVDDKLLRNSRISQNLIVWTTIFIYPLFSGLDFLYINHLWIEFLLLRFILLGAVFLLFEFVKKSNLIISLPIHILLGGITLQMIFFSLYAPLIAHYFYMVLLSVSSVFILAVMVWRPQHSVFQVLFSIISYIVILLFFTESPLIEYLESGGFFYIGVMMLSAFISALRFEYQGKNVKFELYQEKYREILQKEIRNIIIQRDKLSTSKHSLEDLNIEKNRFLNVANHGVKNPLTRIFGFLQIISIEFSDLPDKLRQYLDYIEDSAHEINEVMDRYVNLKAFNKEPIMKLEAIDILPIIKNEYKKFSFEAHDRNIDLNIELPKEPVEILGDLFSLKQIFSNLIKYSIKLAANNGELKIIVEKELKKVRIHITQSRININIEQLDDLFDSLESITKEKRTAMPGQGLGLSLAKVLTHNLNGNLYYSANPHSGLYFMVEYPLQEYFEQIENEKN